MAGAKDRSLAWRLTRKQVRLARTAPELVPALVWLVATCKRSKLSTYCSQPPVEELAAVVILIGAEAKEMLESTASGRRLSSRLPDVSDRELLKVRAKAAIRLGLGVESVLEP